MKKYKEFINESLNSFPIELMNNEERKQLQHIINTLSDSNSENFDKNAKFIHDTIFNEKTFISSFYIYLKNINSKIFIKEILSFNIYDWKNKIITSEEYLNETKEELISYLLDSDYEILDKYTKEIYLLSNEEEKIINPKKNIHKYNL